VAGTDEPGDDADLAGVASQLYALAPEDFVAARNARAKQARAGGARDLARRVGALPKPTAAAWLLNQLARHRPDAVAELVGLGDQLRDAQSQLAGDQLRGLGRQRQQVVAAFARQAAALADELGRPLSETLRQQVEKTLRAAVADAAVGQALLTGRLTSALTYVGMGEVDVSAVVAAPRAGGRIGAEAPPRQPEVAGEPDDEVAGARQRRRAAAQEAVRVAEADGEQAASELHRQETLSRDLDQRWERLRERIDTLRSELDRVEAEADELEDERTEAGEDREAAVRRATEAADAVQRARDELDRLPRESR